jgi:5'-methylthioadenosine phosphorylase
MICGHEMPTLLKNSEVLSVITPYGEANVKISKYSGHDLFFINRHGENRNIPPHKINYRCNIKALYSCHVDCVFSIGTVGSMKEIIKPSDFVIPHDFVDNTKLRKLTFFDDSRVHVDMSSPFCPALRKILISKCKEIKKINTHSNGVYLCSEGPRLETVSEIKLFSQVADIVGMTIVPEVILAREVGICYASLCVVCNMAAGLQNQLTANEISSVYSQLEPMISEVLENTIKSINEKEDCNCRKIVSEASI